MNSKEDFVQELWSCDSFSVCYLLVFFAESRRILLILVLALFCKPLRNLAYCFLHPWQTLTKSPRFRQHIFRTVYYICAGNLLKKETDIFLARATTFFSRKMTSTKYCCLFAKMSFKKMFLSPFSICLLCTVQYMLHSSDCPAQWTISMMSWKEFILEKPPLHRAFSIKWWGTRGRRGHQRTDEE